MQVWHVLEFATKRAAVIGVVGSAIGHKAIGLRVVNPRSAAVLRDKSG